LAAPKAPRLSASDRTVLRLGFAAMAGFAIALAMGWELSFLAPMLAVQMTAAMPKPPGLREGLIVPLVIYVGTMAALVISTLFVHSPPVLMVLVAAVIWLTFYAQRLGAPAIVMLLTQIAFCGVPLISTVSLDLAHLFAEFLQKGSIAAVITVWLAHAVFPAPPTPGPTGPPPKPPALSPGFAARVALSDSLVLLPLLFAFMMTGGVNNFIFLMMTINVLREVEFQRSSVVAVALISGNVLGGLLALFAQQFTLLADNPIVFALTVFVAGLWFASRMVKGGPMAPIYSLAFATFILLLGLAITPIPGGSEEMYVVRITKVALASLYALAALSLVEPLRRDRRAVAAGP
jgi:hypothetical protein